MMEPGEEMEPNGAPEKRGETEPPIEAMFKRVFGFTPGVDDELWEKMERSTQELIEREGTLSERIARDSRKRRREE